MTTGTTHDDGQDSLQEHFVALADGQPVFQEGQSGTEMYVIEQGQIELHRRIRGSERRLVVLGRGELFGEMSLLEGVPHRMTARAVGSCRLLKITREILEQVLQEHPDVAVTLVRKLARRVHAAEVRRAARESPGEERPLPEAVAELPAPPAAPAAESPGATPAQPTAEPPAESSGASPEQPAAEPPPLDRTVIQAAVPEEILRAQEPARPRLIVEGESEAIELESADELTIGRSDPASGLSPDVDLTAVDTDRSTSRLHARILRQGERFYLREDKPTTNGTYVNDQRLEPGVPVEIQDGDELKLGLVHARFHC